MKQAQRQHWSGQWSIRTPWYSNNHCFDTVDPQGIEEVSRSHAASEHMNNGQQLLDQHRVVVWEPGMVSFGWRNDCLDTWCVLLRAHYGWCFAYKRAVGISKVHTVRIRTSRSPSGLLWSQPSNQFETCIRDLDIQIGTIVFHCMLCILVLQPTTSSLLLIVKADCNLAGFPLLDPLSPARMSRVCRVQQCITLWYVVMAGMSGHRCRDASIYTCRCGRWSFCFVLLLSS